MIILWIFENHTESMNFLVENWSFSKSLHNKLVFVAILILILYIAPVQSNIFIFQIKSNKNDSLLDPTNRFSQKWNFLSINILIKNSFKGKTKCISVLLSTDHFKKYVHILKFKTIQRKIPPLYSMLIDSQMTLTNFAWRITFSSFTINKTTKFSCISLVILDRYRFEVTKPKFGPLLDKFSFDFYFTTFFKTAYINEKFS